MFGVSEWQMAEMLLSFGGHLFIGALYFAGVMITVAVVGLIVKGLLRFFQYLARS